MKKTICRITLTSRLTLPVRIFVTTLLAFGFFLMTVLFPALRLTAYASEQDTRQSIAITVVVPRPGDNQQGGQPSPISHNVYPVHVWESNAHGRREIIRVYELRDDESPAHIPRDSFVRDGHLFELAEIVRRELPMHSTRQHVETVTVNTQTNDLATVIRLLNPTLEYMNDDGYFGELALDVSSIEIISDGTRTTSHSVTRTREFPNLSSTDTSLVPRTITENGRTYNLTNVEWQTQGSAAIDHRQVATSFTAVATYSGTATRTSVIGYTTTARYFGSISRIATGRTEFTAHFIGIPIVTPIAGVVTESAGPESASEQEQESTPEPTPAPLPTIVEAVTVEQVHIGGIVIELEQPIPQQGEPQAEDSESESEAETDDDDYVPDGDYGDAQSSRTALLVFFIGLGMVFAFFLGLKGKAMLKGMKKTACVLLLIGAASGMAFAMSQTVTVYAVELPRYSFGAQNSERVIHLDNRTQSGGSNGSGNSTSQNSTPPAAFTAGNSVTPQSTDRVIHFDPRITGNPSRASPNAATPLASNHGYEYGDIIGNLTVHRHNRTVRVIAGATMEAMDIGAGHFSFTGLNQGNTGLIAHNRGSRAGFFSFVRELREGDLITLEVGGITRTYAVAMLYTIAEDDFGPLEQFGDNRLTLITCVEYVPSQRRVAVAFEVLE